MPLCFKEQSDLSLSVVGGLVLELRILKSEIVLNCKLAARIFMFVSNFSVSMPWT